MNSMTDEGTGAVRRPPVGRSEAHSEREYRMDVTSLKSGYCSLSGRSWAILLSNRDTMKGSGAWRVAEPKYGASDWTRVRATDHRRSVCRAREENACPHAKAYYFIIKVVHTWERSAAHDSMCAPLTISLHR